MKTVHVNDVFTGEAKHARGTHLTDNFIRELHCDNKCVCTGLFGVMFVANKSFLKGYSNGENAVGFKYILFINLVNEWVYLIGCGYNGCTNFLLL